MNIRNYFFDNFFPNRVLESLLLTRLAGQGVALMYHEVLPDNNGLPSWTVVKESCFHAQMLFLKNNFDILPIEVALTKINHHKNKKNKPFAVITFDDGYKGNLTCALPILKSLHIPVTIYIATQTIETGNVYWYDKLIALISLKRELNIDLSEYGLGKFTLNNKNGEISNWNLMQKLLSALKTLSPQLRANAVEKICACTKNIPEELRMMDIHDVGLLATSSLVTVGGHSHCHNILTQLSDKELFTTLEINRNKLQEWTGQEVKHFSYPNGDYDLRVTAAVKRAGYISAVTTHGGLWNKQCDALVMPRKGVGRFDSQGLFLARMAQIG
jgi:peptidoglycan/xylan/chitin deacetylase (PgdA/CDA1 family)